MDEVAKISWMRYCREHGLEEAEKNRGYARKYREDAKRTKNKELRKLLESTANGFENNALVWENKHAESISYD